MWSLDFIRRKNHEKQGVRGNKWRFFIISPLLPVNGYDAGRLGRTQNALHDGISDSRPAADVGTKVFRKGKSRLIGSSMAPWRPCSHEEEAADKTQTPLILLLIIAVQTSGFFWNIR